MESLKFKTTIKCEGCVAKVAPKLDETVGAGNWSVDLNNPARILTVTRNNRAEKVKAAVESAGYKAENL